MKTPTAMLILVISVLAYMVWSSSRDPAQVLPTVEAADNHAEPSALANTGNGFQWTPVRLAPERLSLTPRQERTQDLLGQIEQVLNSANDLRHDSVFTNLFPALVAEDIEAAARLLETMDPGMVKDGLMRLVAQGWAKSDSTSALQWASTLSEANDRDNALTTVCMEMSRTYPSAAIEAAERFGIGNSKGTLENLAMLWAGNDMIAARNWASQQPTEELRDHLLARIAYVQALTDPQEAACLVAAQIRPGSIQIEAAISVLHQWALRDPDRADAWLQQFPEGPLRERGEAELAGIALYKKLASSAN